MRTLVTGGGGFLGRYIVEQLLDRGDSVTVFARGAYPELEKIGVTLVRGDIQDADAIIRACKGMDVVFHVAAKAGIWGTWASFYEPNVVGTENVIQACVVNNVPKLVYTSSPSVIFDGQPQEGVDESCPYPQHYKSLYAQTKAIAEQKVIAANDSARLLTTSLRPHFIWGPRDTHILPGLLSRARAKKLIQVGPGTNKKDLAYVEDVARAHLLAADALEPDSPVAGSVYFISQDEPVLFWLWVEELMQDLGLPGIQRRIPLPVAQLLGSVMEGVYKILGLKGEPLLTRFLVDEMGQSQYYDISRAKQDFGYRPQFSMTEAREKTLAYLLEDIKSSS